MASSPTPTFEREERYIVVKRKHMVERQERALRALMSVHDIPTVECVVVESDWPEYETVWAMIEARCTGTAVNERATLLATNAALVKALVSARKQIEFHLHGNQMLMEMSVTVAIIDEALALATVQP